MPIDPNIPLSYRPATITMPDLGETIRLRDLIQTGQQRQWQMQRERQAAEKQDALRKAMVVDEQGRVDLPKSLAAINRIDPTVGLELQAKLQEQQQARQQAQVKDLSQRAFALRNMPAERRAEVYPEMRRQALATGLYKPEDLPEEVPSEEMLQALSFGALTPQEQQKVLNLIAEDRRAAAKEGREVTESKARTEGQQLTNLQTEMGIAERTLPQNAEGWAAWRAGLSEPLRRRIPETYSPEAVAQVQRMALPAKERKELENKMPTSAAQLAFMASDPRVPTEQRRAAGNALTRLQTLKQNAQQGLGVPGIPNATPLPPDWKPGQLHEAALSKYRPDSQRLARQLVEYKVPMPTGAAVGREPWASAIQAAGELDPTWVASEYHNRLAARRSFTSGKDANTVTAINTAIGHLKTLALAAKGLNNWWFRPWNKIANNFASETGKENIRKFNVAATALENELATVFKQTGATDQEIKAWRKDIDSSDSPEQLDATINQAIELMASRLNALYNKWETAMGKPADFRILSDKSAEILRSIGIHPGHIDPSFRQTKANAGSDGGTEQGSEERGSGGNSPAGRRRYNPATRRLE
jgi:hypothetical protein